MEIKVIATIKAKEEFKELVKAEAQKLLAPTRLEKGCISYEMYLDLQDSNTFVIVELWASKDDLDIHGQQPPLNNFKANTEGKLEAFNVQVLTKNK